MGDGAQKYRNKGGSLKRLPPQWLDAALVDRLRAHCQASGQLQRDAVAAALTKLLDGAATAVAAASVYTQLPR